MATARSGSTPCPTIIRSSIRNGPAAQFLAVADGAEVDGQTPRSTQIKRRGTVAFVDRPDPRLQPGHMLVWPLLISLCGSDVHMLHHAEEEKLPFPIRTTRFGGAWPALITSTALDEGVNILVLRELRAYLLGKGIGGI